MTKEQEIVNPVRILGTFRDKKTNQFRARVVFEDFSINVYGHNLAITNERAEAIFKACDRFSSINQKL